jgi:PIN domain nuclease of toxin-antitoxin system
MRPFQKRYSKPLNHESAVGYPYVHSRPDHHRDPFDRMLVAQSQIEKMPIVTGDGLIARYDVTVIW